MEKQDFFKKSKIDSKSADKDFAKSKSNSSKNNLSVMDVAGSSTATSHIVRNISSDEKVVNGIDLSKPPPKPPRKLDPLSLSQPKQYKSKSDDDKHLHSSSDSKTEERKELQSSSETPALLQSSGSAHKIQNGEGQPADSNLARDDGAKVNEAQRLARERVLRKIKAEKEKLEEEEKRKLQELQTRQESSAVKVKRLQEKTLERVAQLKEQAERMQMQAKESEFEEEARRVASEQQVQSEEYMLRMKRLRQEARRRVKQQEKKEEMLAYQQEIELQQQLRIRKQQYDVSTTFIPAVQQTKPRNNQNNSNTNNNRNKKVQISSLNTHEYSTSQNSYYEADSTHQPSQSQSNNNNYYYSDEIYPQHAHSKNRNNYTVSSNGNQPYREYDDGYDSNNNGNGNIYDEFNDADLQREENAYIAGDNAYLQQQDRQQRLYMDDTGGDCSGDRRPWRPHTDSGNSTEEQRVSVPPRPATTNDSMSSNNSHGQYNANNSGNDENGEDIGDFVSNTEYQMPRYAFGDTNESKNSNNRDRNIDNNRHYFQDTDRNNSNVHCDTQNYYNVQPRPSMNVSRDTQQKQQQQGQQQRRQQELENAVSQWLSGEDDTTLAAKQDLYSPSKQSKSSNKSRQSNNNKTRNAYGNKVNRSDNFQMRDDDSSSWGSNSDEGNQNNHARYKSHQYQQQGPGAFPKQDMDLDDTADDVQSTVSDLTDQEEMYKSSRKKASDAKILPKASFGDSTYTHKNRNKVHDTTHATTSVTQQLQPIAPAKAIVPQPFHQNSPKLLYENPNNNPNSNSGDRSNKSKSQSSPEQISKTQQSTVNNRNVAHRTRKPKPFHALPVIPIAPYNPVPANY